MDLLSKRDAVIPYSPFPSSLTQKAHVELDWTWHRDGSFRWSRDGRLLAFTRCSGDQDKPMCLVFLQDVAKTSHPQLIAEELALGGLYPYPRFEPVGFSGQRLFFRTPFDLYTYDLVSRQYAPMGREIYSAAVSPDGRTLAYVTPAPNGVRNVWISDIQGTSKKQLTTFSDPPPQIAGRLDILGWFPDGQAIVFRRDAESRGSEAWAIRTDSSGLERIGW
jgi:Tol biopolymer transport system component